VSANTISRIYLLNWKARSRQFPTAGPLIAIRCFIGAKTTKRFSGADEAIFPSLRKQPETDPSYQNPRTNTDHAPLEPD
jgi:hypothetical protein